MKHFELPTAPSVTRRVETRVFFRQVDRWIGYTYRWNDTQTPEGHRRCVAVDSVGECTIADVVRLRRALAGLPPPVEPLCNAATEPDPQGPESEDRLVN